MRLDRAAVIVTALVAAAVTGAPSATPAAATPRTDSSRTPIQHLVVIFQENVSFDHYFGTYPEAANPPGEPAFHATPGTPAVDGLSPGLLTENPNLGNPHRLDRSEALTCDQDHDYTPEQQAVDHGVMDMFVQETGGGLTRGACDTPARTSPANDYAVMDYYDGNTVTALWNYAQHFAMSDSSFGTSYGPSTPGALNLVAGNTYPALCAQRAGLFASAASGDPDVAGSAATVPSCPGGISTNAPPGSRSALTGTGTVISDPDQYYDVCSNPAHTAALGGRNIGDELSAAGITWGWFNGGFQGPGYVPGEPGTHDAATVCRSKHYNIGAGAALDGRPCVTHAPSRPVDAFCVTDYSAHHEPFQYYASTSNPAHTPPSSVSLIGGNDDGANHQYDLADFWAAAGAGRLPAVSYLKAAKYQDGHAGYSDPLDEQTFLVSTINRLQRLPDWSSTAVVIAYDDSDGWYDHVLAPVQTQSQSVTPAPPGSLALDQLSGDGRCGSNAARVPVSSTGALEQQRCGLGPRLPLLVISPWARENYVDHSVTDQSSLVRFVEDNWRLARIGNGSTDAAAGSLLSMFDLVRPLDRGDGRLLLDPATGRPVR